MDNNKSIDKLYQQKKYKIVLKLYVILNIDLLNKYFWSTHYVPATV